MTTVDYPIPDKGNGGASDTVIGWHSNEGACPRAPAWDMM